MQKDGQTSTVHPVLDKNVDTLQTVCLGSGVIITSQLSARKVHTFFAHIICVIDVQWSWLLALYIISR